MFCNAGNTYFKAIIDGFIDPWVYVLSFNIFTI